MPSTSNAVSPMVWVLIFIIVLFALIGGLIVLYFHSKGRAAKAGGPLKEGDVGFERENRLFSMFQNIEDMMDGFESYAEETRQALEMEKIEFLREKEEITRMHARVSALLQQFREEIDEALRQKEMFIPPPPEVPEPDPEPAIPAPLVQPASARAVSIWGLYCEGRRADEIARELGIAMSEVNLTLKVLLGDGGKTN